MTILLNTYMGDHLVTAGTVSNLKPVCQTKQSLEKEWS